MAGIRALGLLLTLLPACRPWTGSTCAEPASGRPYRLLMRKGHDPSTPAPVLFVLDAYAAEPGSLARGSGLDAIATGRGWLVVLPEGTRDGLGRRYWNATAACCGEGRRDSDDLAYLHGALLDAGRRAAIDPRRVYAVGSSNGAFMAQRWACSPLGDLRALVSISGAAPGAGDPPCSPRLPVSVLEIHGDSDHVIHYEGGTKGRGRYPSAHQTAEIWRSIDECASGPRSWLRPSLPPLRTRVDAWPCGSARVELWTVEGAGHDIPGVRAMAADLLDFLQGDRDAF